MKYRFADLVDIPKITKLLEAFYEVTGFPAGVIDVDGNILCKVGWQDICLSFHHPNPIDFCICKNNFSLPTGNLSSGKTYLLHSCSYGLVTAGAPIYVDNIHMATIYNGQFFLEPPDSQLFAEQARSCGFDEQKYCEAIKQIPVISSAQLETVMRYYILLADMFAQMGLASHKQMETQIKILQESEERLYTIINNTPSVAIHSYDVNGLVRYWNKAAEKIFGWTKEEAFGKRLDDLLNDKAYADIFYQLIKIADQTNRALEPIEWKLKNKDGIDKIVYSTIFPIHVADGNKEFICMDLDITERKHWEKELARLDQLNLIGEMAAGIGHEVRNPMTTVRGFLQMLKKKEECAKFTGYFELMIEELDRANSIITEFLSLAKNKAVRLEMKNLNTIIAVLTPLLEASAILMNHCVVLELENIPDLWLDEKEIRQLILNLVRNGLEAMKPGKYLTIRTYVENNAVVLAVKDQGGGIKPELFEKIGTPFFTTKDNGTGMGLAVCYSIAARHNARIDFNSAENGTTFNVRFGL